ncbi:uncharacterized protein TNCV_4764371 [Trichonephila clavipes]|nr:uncharacterized protein TNCV_4764371 [Trichonephila clavipes]
MTSCNHLCCPLCNGSQEPYFQQDNARPHTAKVKQDCLRTVTTLPWYTRFPDLSPIEHIWDHLGRRVGFHTFELTRGKFTANRK